MTLSSFKTSLLALGAAALLPLSAAAATFNVSLSDTAPEETIFRISVPDGQAADPRMIRNYVTDKDQSKGRHRETGQTFKVPAGFNYEINAVTLRISATPAANLAAKTVLISIYEVAGANSVSPLGEALYEATGTLSANIAALDYITFSLNSVFTAEANKHYSIQLGFSDAPSGASELKFVAGVSTLYTDGSSFWYQNEAGTTALSYSNISYDLDFSLSGTAVAVIPEAKTASLFLGGLLLSGVAYATRRRRSTSTR